MIRLSINNHFLVIYDVLYLAVRRVWNKEWKLLTLSNKCIYIDALTVATLILLLRWLSYGDFISSSPTQVFKNKLAEAVTT